MEQIYSLHGLHNIMDMRSKSQVLHHESFDLQSHYIYSLSFDQSQSFGMVL